MNPIPKLLVVADDLTGANDTGVQFARQGVPAFVFLSGEFTQFPSATQVVVVNTETRHASPAEAARRVRQVALRGANAGVQYFYKKTDSTLRGNLGAELASFLTAAASRILPFVPAFPELGRTTREGIHYVFGKAIAETAFSTDPLNPILQSTISKILGQQTTTPTRNLSLRGKASFENFSGILICDCQSKAEMALLGDRFFGEAKIRSGAGSAAFAQEMARFIEFDPVVFPSKPLHLPVLLVNGSVNERSLAQIGHPCASVFSRHRVTADLLRDQGGEQLLVQEIQREIGNGQTHFLLQSISNREELATFEAISPPDGGSLHLRVASLTAAIVRDLLLKNYFQTLVVFGGDTLNAIAHACGWHGFVPQSELCAGVTVSKPAGSDLQLISKAGGFGEPGLIEVILGALR